MKIKVERNKKKLHRVAQNKHSDWQDIPKSNWNVWQVIAAATYGIVTIGNALTILGLYLVIHGLINFTGDNMVLGIAQILGGRMLDYFDGILADMTKTKSIIGAILDVTFDTIALAISAVILVNFGTVPLLVAVVIAVPKVLNVIGYCGAKIRHKRINPTAQSKIGTGVLWVSVGFFLIYDSLDGLTAFRFDAVAWAAAVIALYLTIPSTVDYLKIGFGSKIQKD